MFPCMPDGKRRAPRPLPLAEAHRRTLRNECAIDEDVLAEYGVRTIFRGCELPRGFSRRQRGRAPGMLFPAPRPNGEMGYSFRPDAPHPDNPGHRYEQPCKALGGPGNVLGVYSTSPGLLRDASVTLVFTEGAKKGLALLSAARAAGIELAVVVVSGVWNWLSDGAPIPDMLEVPVEGRKVVILFDSDMLRNPNVQEAARRLAEHLMGRGAEVWIAYLPDGPNGSKTGADDFFARGGTLQELRMLVRRYDQADFTRIRLSRNGKLRAGVGYLWREWRARDWMRFVGKAERGNWARGHTARDTMEALIGLVPQIGKADERGIVVEVGLRRLSELAAKTPPSAGKAVAHLEADGQIEILPPEDKGKSRRYRLLVPRATLYSMESGNAGETRPGEGYPRCKGLRAPTAPRLRWSSPGRPRRREFELVPGRVVVRSTGRVPRNAAAEDLSATPRVKRLAPHRCAIIDALQAAGGVLTLAELCEVLCRSRPRDVRRRLLPMLEGAGIIECEGDVISLAADWLTRLEKKREDDGEVRQAQEQAEKHREESARYREHLERKMRGTPEASLAAVRRTRELRERRLREISEEEERDRAPTPPAVEKLLARILSKHDRVRLGLLCEIAREEGLRWRDVSPAARRMGYRIERLPEYGNAEFVYAREVGVA